MKASRTVRVSYEIDNTGIYVKAGTDMKRRIRTLVRSGWTLVEVPILPPSDGYTAFGHFIEDKNPGQYKMLYKWCEENVPLTDWTSSYLQNSATGGRGGTKRFVFKDKKFASWFTLMTKT